MNDIVLIGGIAINKTIYGGEVMKNKILLKFLQSKINKSELAVIDTYQWQRNFPMVAMKILYVLFNPKRKVILLSSFTTGAYYFLRIYRLTSFILKKQIYYFIVGGSLPDYVEAKRVKIAYYQNIPMFAESMVIRDRLVAQGMANIRVINNWKYYSYLPDLKMNRAGDQNKIRALYYSRICPEKGVDIIFEALNRINRDSIKIEVDFYGEIQNDYEETFYASVNGKSYFAYKGKIDLTNENNYSILSGYDIMIFPSYYFGEGIPGAIIDCFIAGLPVLASDWNFNKDIVNHMKTGLIFEPKSTDALYTTLMYVLSNKNFINGMRSNCVEKAREFKIEFLLKDFLHLIENR